MRKLKITSLILVVVMLLGMIPMGIFSASAAVAAPMTVPSGTDGVNWEYKTISIATTSPVQASRDADKVANSGKNEDQYEWSANQVSTAITYKWRGMEGFMIKVQTTAASKFFLQSPMSAGSFGWSSYMRITMAQNLQGMNKNSVGSVESDAYIYDGTSWTKQTTNNWGDSYIDLPAGFEGYVYVPFDQFYWQGNGNNGNVNGGTTPLKGCTAEYFLSHFEDPKLSNLTLWMENVGDMVESHMTVSEAQIIYADKKIAPTSNDTPEPYTWTSISDSADGSTRTAQTVGDSATYTITKGNGKPGTGVFAMGTDSNFDLSDVKGLSVHVDTTGIQGGKQMQFRPYLQYLGGFSDTIYRENMIVNATGNVNNTETYTPFYNDYRENTTTNESFCQFVTRTPGSVVYLRADGETEWEVLFNYCTGSAIDSWGGFLLPAGFKGDIYIPMESYWFCSSNNGGSVIIPFNLSLVKDFRSFGLFNSMSANAEDGETNTVTYSNFQVWRDADYDVVEIGTADELVTFFNNLGDYAGKNVVLTNDIVLNAGWDASTQTAPTVKLANRTAANAYFAGTFDGQGHVISGLYLESDLNALGLFGNVDHLTQATVKNVTIVNSLINQTCTGGHISTSSVGLTAAVGSIFGQVLTEVTANGTWIKDPQHVNQTKAIIENVYSDVDIKTTATGGNSGTGYGGLIGVLQADAYIMQSTYAGSLVAHYRGTGGFVGSIYPVQIQNVDYDGDGASTAFYPNDTNGDGQKNNKDTAVYYKNNDSTAAVVGTKPESINSNHCDLTIYNSAFTGSIANDTRGFVGGVLGYNNVCQSSMTLGNVIITGSIRSEKKNGGDYGGGTGGFIQGGSWAGANGFRVYDYGGGNEYQDYRIFNVTAYDVDSDTAVEAFAQTNGALRIWYNDINIDWTADGKYSNAEQKYRNALTDVNKCIYTAETATEIPSVILRRHLMDTSRFSLTLDADLTYKVQIPVGAVVLGPDTDINDVAKVQVSGSNSSIQLKLSDDYTYWEGELKLLPQDITTSLGLYITGVKFNENATVEILTLGDNTDFANWTTTAATAETYLRNLAKDADSTDAVKDLAVDTLKYASATREFHGLSAIDTSKLSEVGYGYTAEDILAEVSTDNESLEFDDPDNHSFEYISFRCDTKLAVQIGVSATGAYTATLDGEAVEVDTSNAADGYILIYLNPLIWSEELQVIDPNTANSIYYEMVDYFGWVLDPANNFAQRQQEVVTALYNYMMSAQAYAASIAE